jgi:hypothetical protein
LFALVLKQVIAPGFVGRFLLQIWAHFFGAAEQGQR